VYCNCTCTTTLYYLSLLVSPVSNSELLFEQALGGIASPDPCNSIMSGDGPFEWLAGGLFFGKKHSQGPLSRIESSKDALELLKGIDTSISHVQEEEIPPKEIGDTVTEDLDDPGKLTNEASLLEARLERLRFLLYDERRIPRDAGSYTGSTSTVMGATVAALTSAELSELLPKLVDKIGALPFESRKHVAAIFNYLLVAGSKGSDADVFFPLTATFVEYMKVHLGQVLSSIMSGLEAAQKRGQVDLGLHYNSMYRSCLRHPSLYRRIVGSSVSSRQYVFPFLDVYVHESNFEVSSDAMETLRLLFTGGVNEISNTVQQEEMSSIAAEFLLRDYDETWTARFNPKLLSTSANYMTRRVALQILSTILLTRSNYAVMIKFVADRKNLILIMNLLRDTSPHITLDAFHVFKVFVANPNKPDTIVQILRDNKLKLCNYLRTLHKDKEESDVQFRDEKALIISTIEAL